MKTLKNLFNTEKLNVEELMLIKGAVADANASCDTIKCVSNGCSGTSCKQNACSSNACSSTACGGSTCNSNGCTYHVNSNVREIEVSN
jgi:hypothetical protein